MAGRLRREKGVTFLRGKTTEGGASLVLARREMTMKGVLEKIKWGLGRQKEEEGGER